MKRNAPRVMEFALLLVAVTSICFGVLKLLPGDPVTTILGNGASDPARVEQLTKDLGLDRPVVVQYLSWLVNVAHGNFGRLYNGGSGQTVRALLVQDLPVTAELAGLACTIALGIAIPLGLIAGHRPGGVWDRLVAVVLSVVLCMPAYVIGPLLIVAIGLRLQLLPVGQVPSWSDGAGDHLRSLVLPATTLALGQIPQWTRLLRAGLQPTLRENFITFARSKGLPSGYVLSRHALRPSSIPLMSVVGVQIGTLLTGAVVVERLFNVHGLGFLLATGIAGREYVLVLGVVTVLCIAVVVLTLLAELLLLWIDPRLRSSASRVTQI